MLQPRGGGRVQTLPFDTNRRPQQGQHVHRLQPRRDTFHRGFHFQDHPGVDPVLVNSRQPLFNIRVFHMQTDQIGAGFGKLVDLRHQNCVGHHQMDVDGRCGLLSQAGHQVRKEQKRRGKVAVRHVDVQDVGMGRYANQIVGQPGQVRRPH